MLIHRENALAESPSTYMILFYTYHFKKNNFNTKSDQNIHQDVSNCTFKKKFSQGSMPGSP